MKSLSKCIFVLANVSALAAAREAIESAQLDDRVVYAVPVATNRVTTISFPGPIAAIDAAGVTADPRMAGQFQLAHSKGSAFFSVKALAAKASANVNVRWGKNTYVFQLEESLQPVLSLILETKPTAVGVKPAPIVSPTRLLALLDKAKAFPLLKQQHPEAVAGVDFAAFDKKPRVSDFDDYEIRIQEAFRFNAEDTLALHLRLKNKTENPIHYRPNSFSLRIGTRVYPQSISDAAGLIPPKGEVTAYFAVTGTPDGTRNELSLKNEFTVLIERIPTPPAPASTNQPPQTP
ncbi:MAG: hypothetical protein L0Z50_37715 [Verrucomicrobiales bacterium]|nr:hypothetical protein [Verrucomicrobiales bacterium]